MAAEIAAGGDLRQLPREASNAKTHMMADPVTDVWAIVDLAGGRRLGGRISGHRIADAGFLRIDDRLYPVGDVACITLATEECARAVAATRQPVSPDHVQRAVARYYRMSEAELDGLRRSGRLNRSRQIAMYLTREVTGASLAAVARAFGARHHTTALRAISNVRRAMAAESDLRAEVEAVRAWVEREAEFSRPRRAPGTSD